VLCLFSLYLDNGHYTTSVLKYIPNFEFFHSFDSSSFLQISLKLINLEVKSKVHLTIDIRIHILL
jgi:hypothetical protein